MLEKFEKHINSYINNNFLSFPKYLEKLFYDDYYKKSLITVRFALILGFILYAGFGFLDNYIAPKSKNYIWIIRYAIVCPIFVSMFFLTFTKFFKKVMQPAMSLMGLIGGFGIVAMIAVSIELESGLYYYAGLLLVLMWSYALVRLRFYYATVVCWILVIGYEITAVFFQNVLLSSALFKAFINNNFFFISSNIIGMFVSYFMESYSRRDFLQRLLIEQDRNELKLHNDMIEIELEMARNIQEKLIPTKHEESYIYSLFKPMRPVGGDFYDFIKFRNSNQIGIFLSDVSGHGVSAALITAMIKTIVLEAGKYRKDPAKLMIHLNELLIDLTDDKFVTAFYGIYDPQKRSIIYSNAGHPSPFIIHNGEITKLQDTGNMPISFLDNDSLSKNNDLYKNVERILPENSKLILYTDGIVEAKRINERSSEEDFGNSIREIFLQLKDLPCHDFVNKLLDEVIAFRGSDSFDDDICVICIDVV